MFFWPLVGAVALDGLALFVATNDIAPSLMLVSFMGIRLLFLMLFAAVFYCQRRMSLRFPLMWEVFNLVLIIVKGFTFLHDGAPFQDAWLLLGLCAASVALELVCVAHLYSSAGTLPRQHVFLHSAVGAMATMNLAEKQSWAPVPTTTDTILDQRRLSEGYVLASGDGGSEHGDGGGFLLEDGESGEDIAHGRQNSFEERRWGGSPLTSGVGCPGRVC
ncbi:unnamed protein product [Ectocarpus sp. 12 AP-2014]